MKLLKILGTITMMVLLTACNDQNEVVQVENGNEVEQSDTGAETSSYEETPENDNLEIDNETVEAGSNMTFSVSESFGSERDVNATLSADDAFLSMVQLISNLFELELSGHHMELTYSYSHQTSRSSWNGRLFRDASHAELDFTAWNELTMPVISIEIDAVTRIGRSVHSMITTSVGPSDEATWEDIRMMSQPELQDFFGTVDDNEINVALDFAYEVANQFFAVGVAEISFGFSGDEISDLESFTGYSLPFTATSEQGQVIEIFLLRGVNELTSLHTPFTEEEASPLISNEN